MTNPTLRDRYPGIRSFEARERSLFFGRELESEDLFGLVKTRSLVVLFAKSGIGKSSIVNAGLLPKLEAANFFPVPVRFQNTGEGPLEIVGKVLSQFVDNERLAQFSGSSEIQLWHKIKASKFGNNQPPVFIFDQFEEFFNHPPEVRNAFTNQLADLADNRLPESVLSDLQAIPRSERTPEQLAWFSPAEAKFLIVIRSDRLSELNQMTAAIPSVLQNRFELKPLTSAQARLAIENPAKLDGDFASPKFNYQPETLRDMLENLRSPKADEIESFQLQILCGEIEKKVVSRFGSSAVQGSELSVPPDFLGGKVGISNILNNYYENQIGGLGDEASRLSARHLIEDQLIADNKRVGVAVETVKIPPDLVEKLLLSRLIRKAPTHLGDVYEISHDTLVEPIARSRDERYSREEKARLEAERLERERELNEQKQRLEAERSLREQAEKAQKEAEIAREEAEAQRQKAEDLLEEAERQRLRAQRNAGRAFWFSVLCVVLLLPLVLFYWSLKSQFENDVYEASEQKRDQKFEEAAQIYQTVLDDKFFNILLFDKKALKDSINVCRNLTVIQNAVKEADRAFFQGEYFAAQKGYENAKAQGFAGLDEKIENTKRILALSLDIFTRKAETFYDAEAYDLACENCQKALRLAPDDPYLVSLLKKMERHCQ